LRDQRVAGGKRYMPEAFVGRSRPAQGVRGFTSGGPSVEGNRLIIPLDGSMALDGMDSYIIQSALEKTGHNVMATARALGTTRETLRYRIQKYNLRTEAPGSGSNTGER
jgi:transcriptional regulator with AAA-type ATPase domain